MPAQTAGDGAEGTLGVWPLPLSSASVALGAFFPGGEAWLRKTAIEKTKSADGAAVYEPGPGQGALCRGETWHTIVPSGGSDGGLPMQSADSRPSPEVPGARRDGPGVKARMLHPSTCAQPPVGGREALHPLSCSDIRSPVLCPAGSLSSMLGAARGLPGPPSRQAQACQRLPVQQGCPLCWSGLAA